MFYFFHRGAWSSNACLHHTGKNKFNRISRVYWLGFFIVSLQVSLRRGKTGCPSWRCWTAWDAWAPWTWCSPSRACCTWSCSCWRPSSGTCISQPRPISSSSTCPLQCMKQTSIMAGLSAAWTKQSCSWLSMLTTSWRSPYKASSWQCYHWMKRESTLEWHKYLNAYMRYIYLIFS